MRAVPMLRLDGSHGEGGGQVLRSASALAVLLGRPIEIENIRAGRKEPGLRPQHAGVVRFLTQATGGSCEGAEVGSSRLRFVPGPMRSGEWEWDIGTAGSITLFLQAVLPMMMLTPGRSRLRVVGGTDVSRAPTLDWTVNVYAERIRPVADALEIRCERRGYYPKGGGEVVVEVSNGAFDAGPEALQARVRARLGQDRIEQQGLVAAEGTSIAEARLADREVAERQAEAVRHFFSAYDLIAPRMRARTPRSLSVGSSVSLWLEDAAGNRVGADGLGAVGRPAEEVGRTAAVEAYEDWKTGATVDRHLADQWVLWVALGAGAVRFPRMTGHLETDTWTCRRFLGEEAVGIEGDRIVGQSD